MAISLGWGSQSRPHDPDDHTRGMWEWPTKHTRVAKAPKAAKPSSAEIRYSHSSGPAGDAWTSVASSTSRTSGRAPIQAWASVSSRSRVHSAAARAWGLNQSRSSCPATARSWLPPTTAWQRSPTRSMQAAGSAPYPTTSPRQKTASLRSAASARTARSASRLAWTSERTAYRTADDQDPVDEAARLLRAELLGDLDRLADHDLGRRVVAPEHLVDGQAQDVR